MLRLIDVALARGARTLYRGVSLIARPGERIGLVGANGCGKSSLFAAILGDLGLEAGSLESPPPAASRTWHRTSKSATERAIDYVLSGHAPLTRGARRTGGSRGAATTRCGWRTHTRRSPNSTKASILAEAQHRHARSRLRELPMVSARYGVLRGLAQSTRAGARAAATGRPAAARRADQPPRPGLRGLARILAAPPAGDRAGDFA